MLPKIITMIATILGISTRLERFSFTIFGRNLVPRSVSPSTMAGWKLPTRYTIVTGARRSAKLVIRFPEIVASSLNVLTKNIFLPPVLFICMNSLLYFGTKM